MKEEHRAKAKLVLRFGAVVLFVCGLTALEVGAAGLEPAPRRVLVPVVWEDLGAFPRLELYDLPFDVADLLSDLPIPVLLPADSELLEAALVTKSEHWYAASISVDGLTIYLRGSRQAFVVADLAIDASAWDEGYLLTRNVHIASLSMTAFGVGYLIEVECSDPLGDSRCTEDEFILGLYHSLALLVTPLVAPQLELEEIAPNTPVDPSSVGGAP